MSWNHKSCEVYREDGELDTVACWRGVMDGLGAWSDSLALKSQVQGLNVCVSVA